MYCQLGLEVISKSCEDFQIEFNFSEFWSEEFHQEKQPKNYFL
jgi:hypothetical protein